MDKVQCGCINCNNVSTHTWSGHPTCNSCSANAERRKLDDEKISVSASEIKDHVFSDGQITVNTSEPEIGEEISIWFQDVYYDKEDRFSNVEFNLNKNDAIALCEHFELLPKERHDQQVDSGDNYTDVMELPVGMVHAMPSVKEIGEGLQNLARAVTGSDQPYIPNVGDDWKPHYNEPCEFKAKTMTKWITGHVVTSSESYVITKSEEREHSFGSDAIEFRPIKSERDISIEQGIEINKSLRIGASEREMFEALYDAGWRPTNE